MKLALVIVALVACSSDPPEPPRKTPWVHTEAERRAAIGDVSTLSPELQRAFDPRGFEPMQPPSGIDWLDIHN